MNDLRCRSFWLSTFKDGDSLCGTSTKEGTMADPKKLLLTMRYHRKSERYRVSNGTDRLDSDFQLLRFPSEANILKLWKKHCPKVRFSLGSYVQEPTAGFWADVGKDTTPKQREAFCTELLTLCIIVTQTA